jgi:hypothetical protein
MAYGYIYMYTTVTGGRRAPRRTAGGRADTGQADTPAGGNTVVLMGYMLELWGKEDMEGAPWRKKGPI